MINIIEHDALNEGRLRYEHLMHRPFIHGKQDCYTLLQDLYRDNLNIELADYARPDDWWISGMDLYNDNFRNEGFEIVEDMRLENIRPLDVFLIAIPDPNNMKVNVANHCAIYIGSNHIVHHRLGKHSQCMPYRYTMKDCTTAIIRHKNVPDLINRKGSSVDILEHILPHKRHLLMGALDEGKNKSR